jgi:hypothetical protein
MTKYEILKEISTLHATLKNESLTLTSADKVSIRNEIGYLEDKLSLIDFLPQYDDVDYGYHDQYDQ